MSLPDDTDISATSNMSALIRAKDWSKTTLGDADRWPASLTLVVNLVLASGFPMAVRWGPDFVLIYNDGYRPILGDKHPQALGLPFREVWPEVQSVLAPLHESILSGERSAFFAEDLLLEIQRHGSLWENAHFTISYSPIPDNSAPTGVGGVLITAIETTNRVLMEEALRKSQEIYRSAMHLGRIGSWEIDFVKGIRTWTREGMALFGINLPDGLGQVGGQSDEFYQAMHPEDRHLLGEYHAIASKQELFSRRVPHPETGRSSLLARRVWARARSTTEWPSTPGNQRRHRHNRTKSCRDASAFSFARTLTPIQEPSDARAVDSGSIVSQEQRSKGFPKPAKRPPGRPCGLQRAACAR